MWIKIYFSVNIFNLRRHHQPRKMSISKSYSSASSENDLSRQLKHWCLHVFLSSIFSVGEIETDVERFLTAAYAQQLKEKHTKIGETHDMRVTDAHDYQIFFPVKSRSGMMRGSRVETAVVPIISSAVNIRDHYIRQLRHMTD